MYFFENNFDKNKTRRAYSILVLFTQDTIHSEDFYYFLNSAKSEDHHEFLFIIHREDQEYTERLLTKFGNCPSNTRIYYVDFFHWWEYANHGASLSSHPYIIIAPPWSRGLRKLIGSFSHSIQTTKKTKVFLGFIAPKEFLLETSENYVPLFKRSLLWRLAHLALIYRVAKPPQDLSYSVICLSRSYFKHSLGFRNLGELDEIPFGWIPFALPGRNPNSLFPIFQSNKIELAFSLLAISLTLAYHSEIPFFIFSASILWRLIRGYFMKPHISFFRNKPSRTNPSL